jgi:tRNA pseudouridine55 synthase
MHEMAVAMARGERPGGVDGFAVVDKEAGWTSHDVVAKARGILGTRKVGHAGTLDPDATGVLILGIGRGTRLLQFVSGLSKQYTAEFVFGTSTSTLDSSGDVVATFDMSHLDDAQVQAAASAFLGPIEQIPPMVSAIKIGGRRLHELAREGIEVERPPRPVTIHRFDLEPLGAERVANDGSPEARVWRVLVECTSGTYIRTLAADLGAALGGGAHLRNLRRTAIGSFTDAEAVPLAQVQARPLVEALRDLPSHTVDPDTAALVRTGRVFDAAAWGLLDATGPWAVLSPDGDLLAVYQAHSGGRVKPAVVLSSES